jgi:hypothetical protein
LNRADAASRGRRGVVRGQRCGEVYRSATHRSDPCTAYRRQQGWATEGPGGVEGSDTAEARLLKPAGGRDFRAASKACRVGGRSV